MTAAGQNAKQRFLNLVDAINVWQKQGVRAPHKPLFLLTALAHYCGAPSGAIKFTDIEDKLGRLIAEYGPPRLQVHPEYPFWRLQNDGLWEVTANGEMERRTGNNDPRRTALRANEAQGKFPQWILALLRSEPKLVGETAERVLNAHFPRQVHERLLRDVGLPQAQGTGDREDPVESIREEALTAYRHRCALSGFGMQYGGDSYGIAPVLIRWPQAGGEVSVRNTLVLSSVFADLFVHGLITVTPKLRLRVAPTVEMSAEASTMLSSITERTIEVPLSDSLRPAKSNLRWHNDQVFRDVSI